MMTPEQIRQTVSDRIRAVCDLHVGIDRQATTERERILKGFQLSLDQICGEGVCTADSITPEGVVTITIRSIAPLP